MTLRQAKVAAIVPVKGTNHLTLQSNSSAKWWFQFADVMAGVWSCRYPDVRPTSLGQGLVAGWAVASKSTFHFVGSQAPLP